MLRGCDKCEFRVQDTRETVYIRQGAMLIPIHVSMSLDYAKYAKHTLLINMIRESIDGIKDIEMINDTVSALGFIQRLIL